MLVKDRDARFENVTAAGKYCVAATFRPRAQTPEVVLASAHADAFSSLRRRVYTGEVVDWARTRGPNSIVFIGGDFNFELDAKEESHFYSDNLKHDSEAYNYLLKYFRDFGRDSGYTSVNDRRIDYFFGPTEKVSLRRVEVLRGAGTAQMDHWPLLVEVAL